MADRWKLFNWMWQSEDDDAPITDASNAEDILVEDAVVRFQGVSKEVTDMLVELSAAKVGYDALLQKYREAVTMGYSSAQNNDIEGVKSALGMVLDK